MELSQEEVLNTQDQTQVVNEIVKAVLMLDSTKAPFKQADINRLITKKPGRKTWVTLMKEAKKKLVEMGLKLVEIDSTNTKSYILTSCMFPTKSMHNFASDSENADRTLLILILSFILIKEGTVTDVDLFNHLQKLTIYDEVNPVHEYFGDIKKKVLRDFVRQMYLEKLMEKDSDLVKLKWGPRAHAEVSKRDVLNFICTIGFEGKITIENLGSQYKEFLNDEEPMAVDD